MHARPLLATLCAASLLGGLAATTPASAAPREPDPAGTLVLIGGALDENATILERIARLADPDGDGPQAGRIALITPPRRPLARPRRRPTPTSTTLPRTACTTAPCSSGTGWPATPCRSTAP